jgi:hypothetical protein
VQLYAEFYAAVISAERTRKRFIEIDNVRSI